MDFTLTDIYGQEKGPLEHCGVNMVLGTDNDFQITIQNSLYDKERHGKNCRFFCPDTEYGGLIRNTNPVTADKTVKLTGMTWRGLLNQRAINPDKNIYVYLNGEANVVLAEYISKLGMREIFEVSGENSGITIRNFQVPLQTMLLDAFDQALALQNAKVEIRYKQGPANGKGYVQLRVVPITDHSGNVELNEDGSVKLNILDYQNGVNHLICLGAGELEQRQQVDLYAWPDGSIQKERYYTGIDLIEQYYENTTVDTLVELEEEGRKKLEELMNYKQLKISVDDTDLELGDIVGGRERITNIYMAAPVIRKIVDVTGRGRVNITYKLKGEE
jgi:hypothetical protein|nr:MAG TPA: Protein gp18.1, prophage tail protein gp18.7A [Caudoviricetes sp.]